MARLGAKALNTAGFILMGLMFACFAVLYSAAGQQWGGMLFGMLCVLYFSMSL